MTGCYHIQQINNALGEADRRATLIEIAEEETRQRLEDETSTSEGMFNAVNDFELGLEFSGEFAELLFEASKCPTTNEQQLVQFTKLNDLASKLKEKIIEHIVEAS